MMPGEVTLVGELNPYGGEEKYALYPAPDGCSGHRLCCLILGMTRRAYLDCFLRVNLCAGYWFMPKAVVRARQLRKDAGRMVLLGAKVSRAFCLEYEPFNLVESRFLILPHPSGMCRAWNDPKSIDKARAFMKMVYPEIAELIGVAPWSQ